jgi:hypothetical protein
MMEKERADYKHCSEPFQKRSETKQLAKQGLHSLVVYSSMATKVAMDELSLLDCRRLTCHRFLFPNISNHVLACTAWVASSWSCLAPSRLQDDVGIPVVVGKKQFIMRRS